MKIGIDAKRTGEKFFGFGFFTEREINHAGMKKQLRVLRSQSQCLIDRRSCLFEFSVSIKIPRYDVVGVHIAPVLQLAERKLHTFLRLDIVIGIKIGELAVVENFVDLVQPTDVLDQFVLLAPVFAATGYCVNVSQGGDIIGHRQYSYSFFIKSNRVLISLLSKT